MNDNSLVNLNLTQHNQILDVTPGAGGDGPSEYSEGILRGGGTNHKNLVKCVLFIYFHPLMTMFDQRILSRHKLAHFKD